MKKIISLILSIALLATLMPTILVSADTASTQTFAISADTMITPANYALAGSTTKPSYGKGVYGADEYVSIRNVTSLTAADVIHLLYKVDMSDMEVPAGKFVEKVELGLHSINGGRFPVYKADNLTSYFYVASTDWDEATLSYSTWKSNAYSPIFYDDPSDPKTGYVGVGYARTNAEYVATSSNSYEKMYGVENGSQLLTYDITNVFKAAYPTGSVTGDGVMSFAMVLDAAGKSYPYADFATKENTDSTLHPYVTVTYGEMPALTEVSATVPEMLTDVFTVEMSNNIASAEVTVNGAPVEESQYAVSGGTLSLNYTYAALTDYNVVVNITDVYGQNFTKTYTFMTRDANGADASGVIKRYITEDTSLAAGNISSGGYGKYNSGSDTAIRWRAQSSADAAYLLHKIPTGLVNIPEGKAITKVELGISTYYDSSLLYSDAGKFSNAPIKIYSASSDWTESTTMQEWCPDYTTTPDITHIPEITWNSSPYCTINSDPAVTTSCSLVALSTDAPSQNLIFDITPVYSEALSKNLVDSDGNFSVITRVGTNSYWGTGVASAENENTNVRPYVLITISDKVSESQTASEFYSYTINTGTTTPVLEKSGTVYVLRNNSKESGTNYAYNCTVLMKFALTNDYYDEFSVTYTSADSPAVERIYGFDNDNGTSGANLFYEDLDATLYDSTKLIGAPSYEGKTCTIDVADYANECVANGKSAMYLLIGTDGNTSSISKILPTAVTQKAIAPSITLTGSTPTVAGSYIKSVDAKFTTVLANSAAAKVELYKGATKVEDVTFVSKGNTIDFAAPTKLEENTSYKVILKAGATDLFGNTTTEDIEIANFTTGVDFVNHGIKLFAKDTEVEKDAFATTNGLPDTTVGTEVQGYWRADNNAIEEKALIIAIGAYDDNNELLGVQFSAFDANEEETKIYKTNVLTVPTGATKIKAFGWDGTSQAGIAFAEIPVQ